MGRERLFQLGLYEVEKEVFPVPIRTVFRPDSRVEGWLREYMLTCIGPKDIVSRTDWDKVKQLVNQSPGLLSAPAKAVRADQGDVLVSLHMVKHSAVPAVEDVSFRNKRGREATYRMATIGYVYGNGWCCSFFEVAGRLVRNAATAYRSAPVTKEDLVRLLGLYVGEQGIQISNLDRQARAARHIIEVSLIWPESEAV